MSEIFLKSSNLSLGYSNQIVIKGLDIQLSYTNDYQIIGKNGAGKTTLMNFIALNFDGSHFESKVNRSQISINQISSTSTLIQELTLSENIDYYTSETSLASEEKLNIVFKYLPEGKFCNPIFFSARRMHNLSALLPLILAPRLKYNFIIIDW